MPTPLGDRAWLLPADSPERAASLAARLRREVPEAIDVVSGFSSVVVVHDGHLAADSLAHLPEESDDIDVSPRRHRLAVALDGPDVEEALERTGLSVDGLRRAITAPFEVAVVGFSPGFAYLSGLTGPVAALPRRATPRPRVPAGSLAVAAGMAAIYPQATPGGWWLLGRSSAVLFDASRPEPALLSPGDMVELDVVEELGVPGTDSLVRSSLRPLPGETPALLVAAAPPLCTVVDDGRRGVAHLGVPPGGPADPERALIARLVAGGSSAIEVAGPGLELEVLDDVVVALVDLVGTVDGREVPSGTPLALGPGQRLVITAVGRGQRGYLGVSGGVLTSPVLGSIVTDSLSVTGPGFLAQGDLLGGGSAVNSVRTSARLTGDQRPARLRFMPGPHAGVAPSLDGLHATLSATSSKVGLRFDPRGGSIHHDHVPIESMPVVTGAIQLLPDGGLVVLGPDHATLGGYPVIGVVISADLGRAGRLAPGDEVVFERVTEGEAAAAAVARAAMVARGVGPSGSSSLS